VLAVLEPTVVEADVGPDHYHLASTDDGGIYIRDPARTHHLDAIDADAVIAWLSTLPDDLSHLAIGDGWYAVDALPSDSLYLHGDRTTHRVPVVARRGRAVVFGPPEHVLVPPFRVAVDTLANRMRLSIHWSPWLAQPELTAALDHAGWPEQVRRFAAYAFRAPLSLAELRARLDELGPYRWIERDNDRWGDYISTRSEAGMIKIFVEHGDFAIDLKLDGTDLASVWRAVFEELLPAVGAELLGEVDTYE
jgi:hypothetical protein